MQALGIIGEDLRMSDSSCTIAKVVATMLAMVMSTTAVILITSRAWNQAIPIKLRRGLENVEKNIKNLCVE